ncbi:abortive infection system antitoxin AbiGi family protein, partial [Methylomonas sp. SURF-1]
NKLMNCFIKKFFTNCMHKNPMKKSVHSETLFHVCKQLDTVKSILSDMAFRPSFAREVVNVNNMKTPYYWVPMVSFCDFKLSELDLHFQKYGYYGIGASKDWGIGNGLNPVLYLSQGCMFFGDVREAIIEIHNIYDKLAQRPHNQDDEALYQSLLNRSQTILKIYSYTKNYQGDLDRDGEFIENFRFADDKEWRFVPQIEPQFWGCNLVNPTKEEKRSKKERLNNLLGRDHWLRFEYTDIKFLVVSNESESMELIEFIEKLSIDHKTRVLLISKILIVEHLEL